MDSGAFDPVKYASHARHQKAIAFRLFAQSFANLSSFPYPSKALDIGCGAGGVTKLLSHFTNFAEIHGLDYSETMVRHARSTTEDPRIKYSVGNAAEIETWPEEIVKHADMGVVTANALIHWLENPQLAMENAHKVLKSGGLFMGYTIAGHVWPQLFKFEEFFEEYTRWSEYKERCLEEFMQKAPGIKKWTEEKKPKEMLKEFLENAGFEVLRCTLEHDVVYLDEKELKGWIESIKPLSFLVPADGGKEEFLADVVEFILKDPDFEEFTQNGAKYYRKIHRILEFVARKPSEISAKEMGKHTTV